MSAVNTCRRRGAAGPVSESASESAAVVSVMSESAAVRARTFVPRLSREREAEGCGGGEREDRQRRQGESEKERREGERIE